MSQIQKGANFDFDAMPMVSEEFVVPASYASTNDNTEVGEISLVNLGSVIDYQVYSSNDSYATETIISVQLTANKAIAGSFTKDITGVINSDESTLTISGFTEESVTTSVTSPAAIGTTRSNASHVYMVIAPVNGESEAGITGSVLVTTNKAKYTFSISTAQKFKRSGLKSFGLNLANCANRVEEETAVPTTNSYKLDDYYKASEKVNPLILDDVVTLTTTTSGNSGKFFGSAPQRDWRLYQSDGAFVTVTVPIGYELQSIQFTYNTSNGGTLEGASSGEVLRVSGRTKTYNVINTGSETNGQVRLTAISVSYISVPVPEGYQLATSLTEIETGLYVIAAKKDGKYYAMSNTFASKIGATEISVTDGIINTSIADSYAVTITKGTSTYTIEGSKNVLLGYDSSTDFSINNTNTSWTVSLGKNGTFRIANNNTTTRVIAFNGSLFGAYASSNVSSGSNYFDVELFKFNGTPKTKPTILVTPAAPIHLEVGDTQQLTVDTNSDGAKSYESSVTEVATVTNTGLITAIAAGTTTITVKTASTDSFREGTSTVTVEVTDPNTPELSVSPATSVANPASWPADNDDAKTFTVTATNGTWKYDDSGVSTWANVTRNGDVLTVTPIMKQADENNSGSIVITLTPTQSGYENQTATIYLSQAKYSSGDEPSEYKTTVTASKVTSSSASWTGTAKETWSVSVEGGATNQNVTNEYAQVGTKNSPSTSITFSTSGISGTIKSITINCASYSGLGTVNATVGGSAFGTQSQSIPTWSNNAGGNVTFSGSASGAITIEMTNGNGGRAMYIKSITVTYEN